MKKISLYIFSLFLISSFSFPAIKLVKVGVVDLEKVFASYPGISDIQKRLKDERENYDREINKKNEEIKILEASLTNELLSDNEKQVKIAEIEYKKQKLNDFIDEANAKLNSLKNELTKSIYSKIWTVIQRVGVEKGYSLILKKSGESILYIDKEIDITSDVITKLKKELEVEKRN
ncbi:MAG: OmpH family outer membrane protein [Brevinematia bacterium]